MCSWLYGQVYRLGLEKIHSSVFQQMNDSFFVNMAPAELHLGTIFPYMYSLSITVDSFMMSWEGEERLCLSAAQID